MRSSLGNRNSVIARTSASLGPAAGGATRTAGAGQGRYIKGTTIEKPPNYDGDALMEIVKHPLNLLMLCLPFALAAYFLDGGPVLVFWLTFFSMIPLAKVLGDATEELAAGLKNDMIAGLLNATFGNAVEVVITVQTLKHGFFNVVKATLLGSVLSNTLLVLGMSFLCGGLSKKTVWKKEEEVPVPEVRPDRPSRSADDYPTGGELEDRLMESRGDDFDDLRHAPSHAPSIADFFIFEEKIQSFSVLGALVNTSMLLISCMSFSLITVFRSVTHDKANESYAEDVLLPVSRISSIIIMMAYCAYIFFQLVTHKESMQAGREEAGGDQAEDNNHLSVYTSCTILCVSTAVVAGLSEMLLQAIKGVTEQANMSDHFIGIILLPIVGNACEHAAAVRFAIQDNLGLSVSIAVGSSTQIALFVVPFSVMAGWAIGQPMDLNFGTLNTSMITLSVIVVLSMVVDGQSNWLQGYLLCSVYAIIAVMYWYLPDGYHE